jgi:8-oxo-dGTP diphosphatase
MNPFESGARKNIPAVLIYARNGDRVLMIHRDAPERAKLDYHAGKWNGLGGKSEADESSWETASREFAEEAGVMLPPTRFNALGVIQFPNFKAHKNEDWTIFVFTADLADSEAGGVQKGSPEGSLHWIPEKDLMSLALWPGDQYFIPHVASRTPFQGTIWYRGSEVVRQDIRALNAPGTA